MRNEVDLLATVTVLGVLEQAYFTLQVIYARRKYKISPPATTGHPEFERIFRAQLLYCESRHSQVRAEGCFFLLCSYGASNAGAKLGTFTDPFGFQQGPDSVFHLSRAVSRASERSWPEVV
ncbi:leukotriene c4 synthase-like [Limosa lapponica baueri]|uniref:Leukotriene c4 synthase-like n=1 Tax=Limosa lapponica baueri TaxID=1758121 RepID=A0A2I0TFC6_LIMLA|nr:leukotriene c4 synthase-like [Limosa lapponica baueri]